METAAELELRNRIATLIRHVAGRIRSNVISPPPLRWIYPLPLTPLN